MIAKLCTLLGNPRVVRIMKFGFLAYGLFIAAVVSAGSSFGQDVLDRKITLDVRKVTLRSALDKIAESGKFSFIYTGAQNLDSLVTVKSVDQTVKEILDLLLSGSQFTYQVKENSVIISRIEKKKENLPAETVDENRVLSQVNYAVTGTVTDPGGLPMPAVNILIKGTSNGVATGTDGRYSIDAKEDDILIFSFIGYKTVETQVGGRTLIDVKLEEEVNSLAEVVINAGYWNVKDQEKTGNISRLTSEEISRQPVTNPMAALNGRLPGVAVQQGGGVPGTSVNIQIRGVNTVRGYSAGENNPNAPLYIIDGVPFNPTTLSSNTLTGGIFNTAGGSNSPLNTLNPSDIESIEVLKDADATAVYGSRGANGVILITTKKSSKGKTNLDINLGHGVGRVARFMDLLNTQQYLEMRREAFKNDSRLAELNDPSKDLQWPDLKVWAPARYTDWQKKLIGGASPFTDLNLSLRGGSGNTSFLISGTYHQEGTVFPTDAKYKRGGTHLSFDHTSESGRFTAQVKFTLAFDENGLPKRDMTQDALTLPPNAPALYTSGGELNWENNTWYNPAALSLVPTYTGKNRNLVIDLRFGYEIMDGLIIGSNVGYTNSAIDEFTKNPLSARMPGSVFTTTGGYFGDAQISGLIIEPQAEYSRKIGKGKLIAAVISSFQQTVKDGKVLEASGFTSDNLLDNIDFATSVSVFSVDYYKYRYASLLGRLNYNWDGKYIVNFVARRDGSSRFGPDRKFATFWATAFAWIFSNETFLNNQSVLSFGKLRSSYGIVGSDQIGDYQYLDSYSAGQYPYNGVSGLVPTQLFNAEYAWESTRKFEIGMELGFVRDLVKLNVIWYLNRSTDQLIGYPLPAMTGFPSVQFNFPATVQNTGIEVDMRAQIVNSSKFNWDASFNISVPENKLLEFPGIQNYPSYARSYSVGRPLSIRKTLLYTGVNPQTGVYTVKDYDGNDDIDFEDFKYIVETTSPFYGGVGNTFGYGGFQFDFFFKFEKKRALDHKITFNNFPGSYGNQPVEVMERWQQPGDRTSVQKFTTGNEEANDGYGNFRLSNQAFVDASYIRLQNVSLSWSMPAKWVTKCHVSRLRAFIQGRNLLTFTKYKGLDPETATSSAVPPLRVWTVGINVTL